MGVITHITWTPTIATIYHPVASCIFIESLQKKTVTKVRPYKNCEFRHKVRVWFLLPLLWWCKKKWVKRPLCSAKRELMQRQRGLLSEGLFLVVPHWLKWLIKNAFDTTLVISFGDGWNRFNRKTPYFFFGFTERKRSATFFCLEIFRLCSKDWELLLNFVPLQLNLGWAYSDSEVTYESISRDRSLVFGTLLSSRVSGSHAARNVLRHVVDRFTRSARFGRFRRFSALCALSSLEMWQKAALDNFNNGNNSYTQRTNLWTKCPKKSPSQKPMSQTSLEGAFSSVNVNRSISERRGKLVNSNELGA